MQCYLEDTRVRRRKVSSTPGVRLSSEKHSCNAEIAFMHQGKIELAGSVADVLSSDNKNFQRFLAGEAPSG